MFEFKYTDCEGAVTTLQFHAETWPEAVERFAQFLRGSGFWLPQSDATLEFANDGVRS